MLPTLDGKLPERTTRLVILFWMRFRQGAQKLKMDVNMGMDFDLVNAGIENIRANVVYLTEQETLKKWRALAQRYGCKQRYYFQFWDELSNADAKIVENGWLKIKEFIAPKNNLNLLFELDDEKKGFLFKSGVELAEVLVESGRRDFYLFDESIDFVICYNDHDAIVADGSAKEWLRGL